MAGVDTAVYEILTDAAALTALVSTRISPLVLPEDTTYPAITYQVISDIREHASGADAASRRARVQINCWGDCGQQADRRDGYSDARDVAVQVDTALSRYSGTVTGVAVIENIFKDLEFVDYEPSTFLARVVQDYTVFYHAV